MRKFTYLKTVGLRKKGLLMPIFVVLAGFLMFLSLSSKASEDNLSLKIRLYLEEASADSVVLKFDNHYAVPLSLRLILELENLQSVENKVIAVVPAEKQGYTIAKFRKNNPQEKYKCSYDWKVVLGDVRLQPDLNFAYALPYQKGEKYPVSQGPDGETSHQHFFAYDFVMPVGTPVTASRDGIVAFVKQDSNKGGADRKFIEDGNYISVYHSDGTMGNYFHLKKNGALVKDGQRVKKGDIIGYSGNTGFSNGAHLHFEVIQPGLESEKNQSVAFLWEGQDDLANLATKKTSFSIFGKRM